MVARMPPAADPGQGRQQQQGAGQQGIKAGELQFGGESGMVDQHQAGPYQVDQHLRCCRDAALDDGDCI